MTDAILTAANRVHAEIMRDAIMDWNAFIVAIRAPGANVDACMLNLIGAAEELERKAKQAAQLMRPELAQIMESDGVTAFQSDRWKASLRITLPEPVVSDEEALKAAHPELWEVQPDKLNRSEMKKLSKKQDLPGISFTNGGAPVLVVSARKDI
ncbi:MAG: hypothetical protein ABF646_02060 [Acetobacter papayae]